MSRASGQKRVMVIGAGMAGLALALALKRFGLDPVVYEGRAEPGDEAGAFLGLAPNGRDVLDTLGVWKGILPASVHTNGLVFLNHRGKDLGMNPQSVFTFKRDLLVRGLREAAVSEGVSIEKT